MKGLKRLLPLITAILLLNNLLSIARAADTVSEFHHSVQLGDVAAVRRMLAQNPGLATSKGEFGFEPIHLIDVHFDESILEMLLARGANINACNDEDFTILHIVAEPEAVKILLAHGADLEARNAEGWTPLFAQIMETQNGLDVIEALLQAGADPNSADARGRTATSLAEESGNTELIDMMRRARRLH